MSVSVVALHGLPLACVACLQTLNGNSLPGSGKGGTITKVTGLGRQWKGDKDANARRYAEQVRKDRIAARQDRLMEDIDALLKTL